MIGWDDWIKKRVYYLSCIEGVLIDICCITKNAALLFSIIKFLLDFINIVFCYKASSHWEFAYCKTYPIVKSKLYSYIGKLANHKKASNFTEAILIFRLKNKIHNHN